MKSRLRLSYSLLLLWSQSRFDEAVALYLHKPLPKSRQMAEGIEFHKRWAKEIEDTKQLKIGKSVLKFKNPKCEAKHVVKYNKWWDLSGTIDCLDVPILYEFKSGVASSLEYAGGFQTQLYFLICDLAKIKIDQARIVHYNQYTDKGDITVVWNNDEQIGKARNYIDSMAPEIYQFFKDQGIPFDK